MDDDLVLNLVIDQGSLHKVGPTKKGGRWTDRLKAKRGIKRRARTEGKSDDGDASRPLKRPRVEYSSKNLPHTNKSSVNPVPPSNRPSQVISSLFTFNPRVELPVVKKRTSVPPAKPSNAPLDSSTFTGLGLHPLLISHLKSKFDIKKPTSIQRASLPFMLSTVSNDDVRDVFIQSQTGSGKTLSYLLPIIQDLLPLSSLSYIDRSIGTLAVIIAPTRELAKQISDVLESLLTLRLRAEGDTNGDSENSMRMTRWLVSGLLIGGSTRTHEKAKLRKGVPILVSTPGRLLDHIQNTASFNVGKCRWLVLDEADQLMELGFEETITGIIKGLDGRHRLAKQAINDGKSVEVGGWDWERRRRAILCSATIREEVQKLAGAALVNPLMIKATEVDQDERSLQMAESKNSDTLTPPSQLTQKYVIAPLKLRLVALIALLRTLIAQSQSRGTKIIVFLSCTDSVDFHWNLFGGSAMDDMDTQTGGPDFDDSSDTDTHDGSTRHPTTVNKEVVETKCALLPDVSIYRLHGSLPTLTRAAALRGFSSMKGKGNEQQPSSSVLLCTSVASRGLDLPLVRAVIQYDLATEGGATEYVHRIGRTARAGKGGEAWSIIAPSEADWVKWVEAKMQGEEPDDTKRNIHLTGVPIDTVLQTGYGGKGREFEARATEVQLALERWVLRSKDNASLARRGFLSHVRAYATHPSEEKKMFHIRHLHLGHLAKAFALREAPTKVTATNGSNVKFHSSRSQQLKERVAESKGGKEWDRNHDGEAERRMKAIVRAQGRLTKKGGLMVSSGASEFHIARGASLERLVHGV